MHQKEEEKVNCKHCSRKATYHIPEDLCDHHWVEWNLEGIEGNQREIMKMSLYLTIQNMYGKIQK